MTVNSNCFGWQILCLVEFYNRVGLHYQLESSMLSIRNNFKFRSDIWVFSGDGQCRKTIWQIRVSSVIKGISIRRGFIFLSPQNFSPGRRCLMITSVMLLQVSLSICKFPVPKVGDFFLIGIPSHMLQIAGCSIIICST
jgi:hypothetical protein